MQFTSSHPLAERLCAEIAELGLTAMIGVANGKSIAGIVPLMSRKISGAGVLYIPPGRGASFVQTLPLSLLLKLRVAGIEQTGSLATEAGERYEGQNSTWWKSRAKVSRADPVAVAEMVPIYVTLGLLLLHQVTVLTEGSLARQDN